MSKQKKNDHFVERLAYGLRSLYNRAHILHNPHHTDATWNRGDISCLAVASGIASLFLQDLDSQRLFLEAIRQNPDSQLLVKEIFSQK